MTLFKQWQMVCAAMLSVFVLTGCSTVKTTNGGAIGLERTQRMLVSESEMNTAAEKNYQQVLAETKQKGILNKNAQQVRRVQTVAKKLIAQTPVFRDDALKWHWEVNVITSDEVNAWCMPGGKIAVYTGILDQLKLTDDELAAVMGHEIAHALREHSRESASERAVANVIISFGSAVLGFGQAGQEGASYAYMGLVGLPNSREHETEADRIGVELAARAGYDPKAAITLWQKMASLNQGSEVPTLLSTHPSNASRMADLGDYSGRVYPLYQQTLKKK